MRLFALVLVVMLVVLAGRRTASAAGAARITESYGSHISSAAKEFEIPRARIGAIILQESSGDRLAQGLKGERGLMQMTSGALSDVNRAFGFTYRFDDMYEPRAAIRAGTAYLRLQVNRFGHVDPATQAYNAGPGRLAENPWASIGYLFSVKLHERFFTT